MTLEIKKGKKQYCITGVRSWNYNKTNLFVFFPSGYPNGSVTYIRNAKVIKAYVSPLDMTYISDETKKIFELEV